MRCADQLEVGRLLECNLLRHRQLGGGIDQLAVAEPAAGGGVHDHAVLRTTGGRSDVPALRGCRHEHDPRRRAGAAQRDVRAANGSRTARQLSADERIRIDLVIGRRVLDHNLVDIHLELFGDQHRQRRVGPLTHLDDGHDERDFARAINAQEGVRRERRIGRESVAYLAARRQAEAKQQTAADGAGRGEKVAPRG